MFDHSDDIRMRIIDSACDLTAHAEGIRLAGIKTVIRYYARGPGQWAGKVLTRSELDALEAQNLSVVVVFQNDNHKPDAFFDEYKKVEDVMWARTHADHLQQPGGTPIYFGVDFDLRHWDGKKSDSSVTAQRIAAVKSYFDYARQELAKDGRTIGVYGCGATCEILEGIADYFWLSASADYSRSGEFYNSGKWHLFQNRVDLTRFYGDPASCPIDSNLAHPDHEDFGQWRRDSESHFELQLHLTAGARGTIVRRRAATRSLQESSAAQRDAAEAGRAFAERAGGAALRLQREDPERGRQLLRRQPR